MRHQNTKVTTLRFPTFIAVSLAALSTHATAFARPTPLPATASKTSATPVAVVETKRQAQITTFELGKAVDEAALTIDNKTNARADAALFRYQQALDLLSAGKIAEARATLETARRQSGDSPEINLLLAYLLQREGQTRTARNRLASVSTRSLLASAYVAQLDRESTVALDPDAPLASDNQRDANNRDTNNRDTEPAMDESSDDGLQQTATGATSSDTLIVAGTIARFNQNNKNLAVLERSLLRRVNAERTSRNLLALTWDDKLAATARAHSLDMRDKKYFAHESPNASLREPLDRYRAVFARTPRIIAENVYRSWGSPRTLGEPEIATAHDALMKSPGHRSNILLNGPTHIGIGIISNTNGDLWVTEMFSRPQ